MTDLRPRPEGIRRYVQPLRILQVTATSIGASWFYDQVIGLSRRGHLVRAVLPELGPLADRLEAAGIGVDIVPFRGSRPARSPASPRPRSGCYGWSGPSSPT